MAKDMNFENKLVEELKSNKEFAYHNASIYTILLDLVQGNGAEHVLMMLHNVATDLGEREKLESEFEKTKNWNWS